MKTNEEGKEQELIYKSVFKSLGFTFILLVDSKLISPFVSFYLKKKKL